MARKKTTPAASPETAKCDREDLAASPEAAVLEETPADLDESGDAGSAPAAEPRTRISGEDLKAMLRQQRREARLKERGY
jgi:hypothetical protein